THQDWGNSPTPIEQSRNAGRSKKLSGPGPIKSLGSQEEQRHGGRRKERPGKTSQARPSAEQGVVSDSQAGSPGPTAERPEELDRAALQRMLSPVPPATNG